jgi:hypothetical protein
MRSFKLPTQAGVRAKLGYCSDSNDAYSLRLPGSCCEKGEKTRKEKNEDKKKTDAGGRAELALCSHSNDEYSLRLEKEKKRKQKRGRSSDTARIEAMYTQQGSFLLQGKKMEKYKRASE